ncbi:hypothetical protein BCV70DRAFT_204235 [Testicularia cyperi]|uniref:Uncharacterized protein n=1 Tax=Testicularia cyperi TaxID=1882483 RepID=A0A317XYU9_9BASI|nr:hypothetical protein BCV70DRAFT_204235 [Testicularia cyperi]
MSSLQRHRNRPRSMTVESLSPTYDVQLVGAKKMTVHSKTNFRPVAYQTKEELDRFFGTTPSQKREQRLRVRESDGRIYYDTIEKEEWRELLAPLTPRCGTPNNLTARRRSSNMTAWSSTGGEGSPLSLASPSHNVMPDEEGGSRRGSYAWSMSPISSRFGSVTVNSSVAGQDTDLIDMEETHDSMPRRARRKRSNSALARSANYVDEGPLRPAIGSSDPDGWQSMPAFKRRLSEQVTGSPDLIEDDATVSEQERIRISRLPLARRKLGSLDMDLAFSPEITNGNAASTTSLASRRLDRPHVPAALQPASKTRPQSMHAACMPLTSSSTSSRAAPMSPLSPSSFGHRRTNGVCKIEGGESSHDTVLVPLRGCAATLSLASPAPSSAATLEVLNSPVCQPGYPLTPTFAPGSNREQGSHQTSRLRHASSMDFSSSNSAGPALDCVF